MTMLDMEPFYLCRMTDLWKRLIFYKALIGKKTTWDVSFFCEKVITKSIVRFFLERRTRMFKKFNEVKTHAFEGAG